MSHHKTVRCRKRHGNTLSKTMQRCVHMYIALHLTKIGTIIFFLFVHSFNFWDSMYLSSMNSWTGFNNIGNCWLFLISWYHYYMLSSMYKWSHWSKGSQKDPQISRTAIETNQIFGKKCFLHKLEENPTLSLMKSSSTVNSPTLKWKIPTILVL